MMSTGAPAGPRKIRACCCNLRSSTRGSRSGDCLLDEESRHPAPAPADLVIDDIARQIRQDPGQPWTVPVLARQACLSAPQFTRRFRACTGSAPGHFVVLARVERARRLLAEATMTIAQIAADLGCTDPAHFSRQYRHYAGHPPTAERPHSRACARRWNGWTQRRQCQDRAPPGTRRLTPDMRPGRDRRLSRPGLACATRH